MYVHNENNTKLFGSKYSIKNNRIYFIRNINTSKLRNPYLKLKRDYKNTASQIKHEIIKFLN